MHPTEYQRAARALRLPPGRDDTMLASWNALTITGMARAARVFGQPAWLQSAQRAFEFVRTVLWRDGRLLATCKDGKAHLNTYLDDHAFLLDAALELLQAEFRAADVDFARALADALLTRFADRDHGGFFFTSHDHEPLIHRTKPGHDHATPSGNGIAAYALQRLGHLLGEPRYLAAAARAAAVLPATRAPPQRLCQPVYSLGRIPHAVTHRRPAQDGTGAAGLTAATGPALSAGSADPDNIK